MPSTRPSAWPSRPTRRSASRETTPGWPDWLAHAPRGAPRYNLTQQDREELPAVHRASTYQQYQGEKLCRRYNAYSYYAILNAFDTHDTGRGRGGVAAALARIEARTAVVGITTDIIFTPAEMRELHGMIAGSTYHEIDSPFGHDGFLVEHGQLNDILYPFMNNQ